MTLSVSGVWASGILFGSAAVQAPSQIKRFALEETVSQNEAVMAAFRERFPLNSQIVAGTHHAGYVWVTRVVANYRPAFVLKSPLEHRSEVFYPNADKPILDAILQLNRGLLSKQVDRDEAAMPAERWWRFHFIFNAVDRVKNISKAQGCAPLSPEELEKTDEVVSICGYAMDGDVFVMKRQDFDPKAPPPNITPLDGSPERLREMFYRLLPRHLHPEYIEREWRALSLYQGTIFKVRDWLRENQNRKEELLAGPKTTVFKPAFWQALLTTGFIAKVPPEDLQPIDMPGEDESAVFFLNPPIHERHVKIDSRL